MALSGTFEPTHFDEGRFRRAYKGVFTSGPKTGQPLVVKENKKSYTWKSTDWDMAVKIQEESQALAHEFNRVHGAGVTIKFADVHVMIVTSASTASGPKKNEYVLVEDYIPGNFKKWCNNYGYISSDSELMPAFMHWSWYHTKGQKMIADLQGVHSRSGLTYTLTDPVLLSNHTEGSQYGCTDMGVEGMGMFFLKHTCNQFCRKYPKPAISDVVASRDAQQQLNAIRAATAYAHELKFPLHIRKKMTTVFPQKASSGLASGYYF